MDINNDFDCGSNNYLFCIKEHKLKNRGYGLLIFKLRNKMLFKNNKAYMNYLVKMKEKGVKPKKELAIEFTKSFNEEAKKQNSKWFAKWGEHKSICDGEKFILLHIHKKLISGWWIFKDITTVSLHIGLYGNHTSFVDNDYIVTEYDKEKNDFVFKYLPEVKPILEKIPQAFQILPKERLYDFKIDVAKIKKEVAELKVKVLK